VIATLPTRLTAERVGAQPIETRAGKPWILLALVASGILGVSLLGLGSFINALSLFMLLFYLLFFARHLAFAIGAMQAAPNDMAAPLLDTGFRPSVSVLVACKNEESVVDGLVGSLLRLDYPAELLQIVIVDDGSEDRTGEVLDDYSRQQSRMTVVHRPRGASGGKSGALNAALRFATGEVIVVFDADHQPNADVVRRLVRHFEDPDVAAAQGRCVIGNPDDSGIARLVSLDYLGGYLVNEYGRQLLFGRPAYGGANCAVRRSELVALGGWNERSVTEDTDLTIRLTLAGRRVRFDVTAIDVEEGVVTLTRFWRQRYRWARGHQQVWRDYRGDVWRSPSLSLLDKIETTVFLLAFHLPVASAFGLGILATWSVGLTHPASILDTLFLWTLLFLGPLLELGAGMLVGKTERRDAFALVLFLPIFLVSIALCTKAWIDGLAGRQYAWRKTARADDQLGVAVP
jgi:1,2-diacylglycerol 3-beta-glucosyltransferase